MKIKAWLCYFAAFCAICVLADWLFTRFIVYGTPESESGRIHHLYQESSDEIPIFGESRARQDYIPTEIGFNTFNYGIDGAGNDMTDTLLQIELSKPKITPVIIDMQIAGSPILGGSDQAIPYLSDARFRNMLRRNQKMIWQYYLPGLRYFGSFEWYLRNFINSRVSVSKKTIRGYDFEFEVARPDKAAFADLVKRRSQASFGYHPDEHEDRRLIAHITAHPERLFFLVYSPYHPSCFALFENTGKFQAFQETLKSHPNVVLIDWSRMHYPDDDFKDTTHFLQSGASDFSRKLSLKIREALVSRGLLGTVNTNSLTLEPPR